MRKLYFLIGLLFSLSTAQADGLSVDMAKFRELAAKKMMSYFGCNLVLEKESGLIPRGLYFQEAVVQDDDGKIRDHSKLVYLARPLSPTKALGYWPQDMWVALIADLTGQTEEAFVQIQADPLFQRSILPPEMSIEQVKYFKSTEVKLSFKDFKSVELAERMYKRLKVDPFFKNVYFNWIQHFGELKIFSENISALFKTIKEFEKADVVQKINFIEKEYNRSYRSDAPLRMSELTLNIESLRKLTQIVYEQKKISPAHYILHGNWAEALVSESAKSNLDVIQGYMEKSFQNLYESLFKNYVHSITNDGKKIIVNAVNEEALQVLEEKLSERYEDYLGYPVVFQLVKTP